MECRWVSLTFEGPAPLFTLSAWQVSYPWVESDSSFKSSNATLDAVFDLCRCACAGAARVCVLRLVVARALLPMSPLNETRASR